MVTTITTEMRAPATVDDDEPQRRHDANEGDGDRVLTVPNAISVARLLCVPLFLYLLFGRDDEARAAYLMGALGATDWVDGYVARHFHQVSELGKVLDPTADRLLLGTGLVSMLFVDGIPRWVVIAVLTREVLISAAAIALAAAGAARIDVTWVGKAGTFCNLFAFPLFLGGVSGITWHHTATALGWGFAVPGLVLSWYAAGAYVRPARDALRRGQRARA
jgi:cardiolipin synthase